MSERIRVAVVCRHGRQWDDAPVEVHAREVLPLGDLSEVQAALGEYLDDPEVSDEDPVPPELSAALVREIGENLGRTRKGRRYIADAERLITGGDLQDAGGAAYSHQAFQCQVCGVTERIRGEDLTTALRWVATQIVSGNGVSEVPLGSIKRIVDAIA